MSKKLTHKEAVMLVKKDLEQHGAKVKLLDNEPRNVSVDSGEYRTTDYKNIQAYTPRMINQKDKRFLITDSFFSHIVSRVEGSILTIIEASTEDKEKREATKSLVRRIIWEEAKQVMLLELEEIRCSSK